MCFVFKSCFSITRWVGNTFQVIFSRKENCNEFSFTCVKSRECISSWCLPEARRADSRIWSLTEGPVPGAVLRVPLAPSVQEPVGPWRRLQVGRRTAKPIPEGMMLLITSTAEEVKGPGEPWTDPSEGHRSKWTRNVSRIASHPQKALLGSLSVLWGSREVSSVHQKTCVSLYAVHTAFKVPLDSYEHISVGQILEGRFGSSCAPCLWRDTKPHVPT